MLRQLEISLPKDQVSSIQEALESTPIVQKWIYETEQGPCLVKVLLDAQHTEALCDQISSRLGARDDFRIVLLAVEATLPACAPVEELQDQSETPVENGAQRISREELYEDLVDASVVTPLYMLMVALSTIVAAIGLIRGDVAIIIGAMVIAPLLGPNIALPLAFTLGDLTLAQKSFRTMAIGVCTAALFSFLMGLVFTLDPNAPELVARTQAGVGDIALALAAGAAGSLAFTSGAPAVVVGVMVAVALLPPVVVAGLLGGSGHTLPAMGALMLALTNVTCINLAAIATFYFQKIRPKTWWEAERAQRATRVAVAIWLTLLSLLLLIMLSTDIRPA